MTSPMAAFTYFARSHQGDSCGSNGLPLTPNSIVIFGRSQFLRSIQHENLCEYLDIIRSKHERTIIVMEYIGRPLNKIIVNKYDDVLKIFYQIASGLNHIDKLDFTMQTLEPKNVLIDELGNVKLFNYGMYYQTNQGEYVTFPIGNIRYTSPERILGSKDNILGDIWSLGLVIAELVFNTPLWSSLSATQFTRKILSLANTKSVLEKIARECDLMDKYHELNPIFRNLLESCLSVSPNKRPYPNQILQHELFSKNIEDVRYKKPEPNESLLLRCPLKQLYYWWQLAGGDVSSELKAVGLIRNEAPILSLPKIVLLNGQIPGQQRSQSHMYDSRLVLLNLNTIKDRLACVKKQDYHPLVLTNPYERNQYNAEMETLPIFIRERDTEYQFHRVLLFTKLLKGYPFTRDQIILESQHDIPPLLRGQIWACLLSVMEDESFEAIDKFTPNQTDRQIEVDIPRCHQYDELLSSPEGHQKLKRLLKAWVEAHPQYVYWQGLDSLTAPFLYLNFNNEERAFLSLYKFIPKYLQSFFLKDNSAVIKEYLNKFSQLVAFWLPELSNHMREINFVPELFAISWFLTIFSHVFPLHKIIHLWDKLLLGDSSYPIFIGISILQQLKTTLLSSCFNDCILLFSDLPDIVMETCVIESQKMYLSTPKSITFREYAKQLHSNKPTEFDINNIELKDLQSERCARISVNDLVELINKNPDEVIVIDIRSHLDFNRAHIRNSINIPFTSISLSNIRLDALGVPNLEMLLTNRIIVVVNNLHETAILFAHFLLDCEIMKICILHNGFNILHSFVPNMLETS